ncbi:hypothetical protein F4780DRAFT_502079 [Xylariomycetidae sp. FL0641]|nr:hypothetical protein F4780DRAFT_502079 [Xylariomycetidae sp. FL0641]
MTSIYTPAISILTTPASDFLQEGSQYPPLVTLWTPPAGCSESWFIFTNEIATDHTLAVASNDVVDPSWSQCQPYSAPPYYSPGICPSGQELKEVTKWVLTGDEQPTDVVYQGKCCNTDLTYDGVSGLGCYSNIVTPAIAWRTPSSSNDPFPELVTVPTGIAIGEKLVVYWHEKDLTSFPKSLAASLRVGMGLDPSATISTIAEASSSVQQAPQTSAPSHSTTDHPTDKEHHGAGSSISNSTMAGIIVSAVASTILLGILGCCALRRRWRKSAVASNSTSTTIHGNMPDIPEMSHGRNIHKEYSQGAWRSELHGTGLATRSDGPPGDPRHRSFSQSTAVAPPMELQGSFHRSEPIPEEMEPSSDGAVGEGSTSGLGTTQEARTVDT